MSAQIFSALLLLQSVCTLQKEHKGVIALLKAASDSTRARFKDIQFQRNKRRKAAAASTAHHSRSWYLPVNSWITGTTTLQEATDEQPEEVRQERVGGGCAQRLVIHVCSVLGVMRGHHQAA